VRLENSAPKVVVGGCNGVSLSEVCTGVSEWEREPEVSRSASPRLLTAVGSDLRCNEKLTGGRAAKVFDRNWIEGQRLARKQLRTSVEVRNSWER
jgi:hypothetical protein